jgi:SAM-dependent methyltransferase
MSSETQTIKVHASGVPTRNMQANSCQVCQSQSGTHHVVREMMLGTRDEFLYWECSNCGCLSLCSVPSDLDRYYPDRYYSLKPRQPNLARRVRDHLYLSRLSFLVSWRPRTDLDVIRRAGLKRGMSLLDVGCGAGSLIADLRELGLDASGVDPFIAADIRDRFGIRVRRKTLSEVEGEFDVVLFRHSLEHMPVDMLSVARARVKQGGLCVVCIPILGWAWKNYATDWAQLDAPRHFFLHSRKSFTLLAGKSGFRIEQVIFDSNEFQFWGSESYQRDVPLHQMPKPSRSRLARMHGLAKALNQQEQGDTAQFYLRPV